MSITKFKTSRFGRVPIEKVEVERETDQSVWVRHESWSGKKTEPRRASKRGDYDNYFDTWAEAHAYLLQRAEAKLNAARRDLQAAQDGYGNVKGMKEPS